MNQLSSYLKLEVSKYKDIDHILNKLEEDGEVQNIFDTFKTIFDNELKFASQELLKIQNTKKEPINIRKQSENNLTLFKNNLCLIVPMIIEKALKTTIAENLLKSADFDTTVNNEETMDPLGSTINVSTNGASTKKTPEKQFKDKERQSSSKCQILNLSLETKVSSTEKRLNFSRISSKVESPISQILRGPGSPARSKASPTHNNSKKSFQFSPRTGPLSVQSSRASLNLTRDQMNKSVSFVQSEFNHIRGSVKFSKSPKHREDNSVSPGPGSYRMNSTLKEHPSQKMAKSPKVCWFDSVARTDSPGPAYNPSKHFCSNK